MGMQCCRGGGALTYVRLRCMMRDVACTWVFHCLLCLYGAGEASDGGHGGVWGVGGAGTC